jgi:hypothetical protein
MIEKLLLAFMSGFEGTGLTTSRIVIALTLSFALGIYIHFVYRIHCQRALYSRSFSTTLAVIAPIMAAMVLTMQSSLIISLSSIGALSIIRFRTPIKDPMDLLYLFWSIGCGIMCGAGVYEVVLWSALMVTVGLFLITRFPHKKDSYILVIHGSESYPQSEIHDILQAEVRQYKVRSQSFSGNQYDVVFEIHSRQTETLLARLREIPSVEALSLITQDGEVDA